MKTCGTCHIEKDLSLFSKRGNIHQSKCKPCHSAYRKQHYNNNKQKYCDKAVRNKAKYRNEYYEWLSTKSCMDCGNKDTRVLEQDHLRNKEFNIAALVGGRTLSSMMDELEKCETVCANCHRIRTMTRGNWEKRNF